MGNSAGLCAIVLSAGLGTRMGDMSSTIPKPLVEVKGRALLDHALDRLKDYGCPRVVVNVHHLPDQIETHLEPHTQSGWVEISDERAELLETGGGVKKALPLITPSGVAPFFVINSDALWMDEGSSVLVQLAQNFDPETMDALLLMVPTDEAFGYDGVGDFYMDAGTSMPLPIDFRDHRPDAPFMFGGIAIVSSHLYVDMPDGAFSNRLVFRAAKAEGRLYGIAAPVHWMHVGTVDAIKGAETRIDAITSGQA